MVNGLLGKEKALEKSVANDILTDFMDSLNRSSDALRGAYGRFFLSEATDFFAVRDTRIFDFTRLNENVLVGKWKYCSDKGVYLRHGIESGDLGVLIELKDGANIKYSMSLDGPHKGCLDAEEATGKQVSFNYHLVRRIIEGVRGYEQIMHSRGLK